MANRSYLYAIDFDRTKGERKSGEKVFGLHEYNYAVPLIYKILVSQSPKLSPSIIWDYEHPIAIQGNFEKGKQKLIEFFKRFSDMFNEGEFEECIHGIMSTLDGYQLENIILECGEIYEMGNKEPEVQNKALFEEDILLIDERIEEYINDCQQKKIDIYKIKAEVIRLIEQGELTSSDESEKISELEKHLVTIVEEMYSTLGLNMYGLNDWGSPLYYDISPYI